MCVCVCVCVSDHPTIHYEQDFKQAQFVLVE